MFGEVAEFYYMSFIMCRHMDGIEMRRKCKMMYARESLSITLFAYKPESNVLHNNDYGACKILFDLNLEYGLPTPIGYLDSSAVLSFQWGRYHDLSNLYCLDSALTKLNSTPAASYTVITNNEVDNHHHNSQFP
jgi:hypothetical protein